MKTHHGFTLIELLVAISIGAIVLLIITTTFQSVLVGGMRADAVVDSQDTGRNALSLISNDIESAGFMLYGASGANQCKKILAYNNSAVSVIYPVMASEQPNTGTAVTLSYSNAFGDPSNIERGYSIISSSINGTSSPVSLRLTGSSGFVDNQVDLLILPTLNACIRLHITKKIGETVYHGNSDLNPSGGLSVFDSYLSRPINENDLRFARLQGISGEKSEDGLRQVTYSIQDDGNGGPVLYRIVIDPFGNISKTAISTNVVYMRALFAPIKSSDGSVDHFVPWSTIVARKQEAQIVAVQFALVVRRKNIGKRAVGSTNIKVLDTTYMGTDDYEYTVYGQTVYLNNVGLNR